VAGAEVMIVGSTRCEHVDPRKLFAESIWKTTSDHGRMLLNRLANSAGVSNLLQFPTTTICELHN